MPLGDEEDFRSKGFQQVMRFPPQDRLGGTGSPFPLNLTQPNGGSNAMLPFPPLTLPGINTNLNLPGVSLPPTLPPVIIQPTGTGAAPANTVVVQDLVTPAGPFTVNTIQFTGSGLVSVTETAPGSGVAIVNYQDTGGGGGGGTTLVYGKITASTRTAGTAAIWNYTVDVYLNGSVSSTVTAYNLLEKGNTTAVAYGYTVTGANYDQITGTSYKIYAVPNNTWVRMEYTDQMNYPTLQYWFSAPNFINGAC